MFEDETIDVACPKCGFKNTLLVQELEHASEAHFECHGCKARVKLDTSAFRHRLSEINEEVEKLETVARQQNKPKPRKGDFQI